MSGLDDKEVNDLLEQFHRKYPLVEHYKKAGRELAFFMALSDIEKLAHDIQIRLNDIKWKTEWHPLREPMGS